MAIQNINIGGAPLLWSNTKYAFDIANDNFQFLEGQLNLNTTALDVDLIPAANITYNIGTELLRWNELHVNDIYASSINIGGGVIEVINNQLVFVNNNTTTTISTPAFQRIDINGNIGFSAAEGDILGFFAGNDISIGFDPVGKSITISSTIDLSGMQHLVDSADISLVETLGDTELFLNNPNKFDKVNVAGAVILTADMATDTVNIDEGYGIILTGNTVTNTMTVGVDPNINIYGNVIGADSTPIVNSVSGTLHGNLYGSVYADDSTVMVDSVSGTIPWAVISGAPVFDNTPNVEYTNVYATPGIYTLDTYDGAIDQVAEYHVLAKAAGGVQFSTVSTMYNGTTTAFILEYGIMLSTGTTIVTYAANNFTGDTVTISITVLYANTTVTFKKISLSNA